MKRVILNHLILNHKYDIMMTVKELIDALLKVEDKSKQVKVASLYNTSEITRIMDTDYIFVIWI